MWISILVASFAVAAVAAMMLLPVSPGKVQPRSSEKSSLHVTLRARVLPAPGDGSNGILEVEIVPKPGLRVGSSRGESHGHSHDQPEFGIGLSAPAEVALSKEQIVLDRPVTGPTRFEVPFTVQGNGPYRIELSFHYEVVEIKSGQHFAPSTLESAVEVVRD